MDSYILKEEFFEGIMWLYQNKIITYDDLKDYAGFVYLITNNETGKKYVGKKLVHFTRTKKIGGRKRKTKIESDWETYYGSNKVLQEEVKNAGQDKFTREILHLCKSKGTASYLEMKEQVLRAVLESDEYYNDQIRARVHRSHLKLE